MNQKVTIQPLTKELFNEAVEVVLKSGLDTKEEIEHHLQHIDAHYLALDKGKVIGVIGWYQDNVNYAKEAMGDKFPGEEAYWVGFFAVDEKYRGQGTGYAMLRELEKIIKEKGAGELWVSSVPETKDYYQRQEFEVFMQGKIGGNPKFFCVKKLKRNSSKKKLLTCVSIIVIVIFLLGYLPIGSGHTGIRPATHGCIGIILSGNFVHKTFPDARVEFPPFAYYVNSKTMNDWNYCLGKDIWWGE